MANDVINAYEIGRQAARQREEDAYVKSRRPIVNAFEDQQAQAQIERSRQVMEQADASEARAQGKYDTDQRDASRDDLYAAGALFNEAIARQIDANPNLKPSEIIAKAPPEVLKRVGLDSPDAQAHFAQIYDAEPAQLRAHAQMYGGSGRKIKSSDAAEKDGVDGFLQTFEDGTTNWVPGYTKKATTANPMAGAYTEPTTGVRRDAYGNVISTPDPDLIAAVSGAKTGGQLDAKEQAEAPAKAQAMQDMKVDIADMRALLDEGEKKKAFPSTKQGVVDNIGAAIATSGLPGVAEAQRAVATDTQTVRDELKAIVPRIANKIMQASKMGVRMLDTEKEYERFIAQINNPSATVQSQRAALDRLERAMVRDVQVSSEPTLSLNGKKLVYNPETGELE